MRSNKGKTEKNLNSAAFCQLLFIFSFFIAEKSSSTFGITAQKNILFLPHPVIRFAEQEMALPKTEMQKQKLK